MASIVAGGIIATVAVIAIGVIVALPPFLQPPKAPTVLLAFSIVSDENMPAWCHDISEILNDNRTDAVVFFTGKVAKEYPQCVTSFDNNVDIGSSTFSYKKLTQITDYSEQLQEVSAGREAVNLAGNLDSKSFKAPYGTTDDNIYSLLSRSGIQADFSYQDRYHKYHQGQFIWFAITVYDASSTSEAFLRDRMNDESKQPYQINIDNTVPVSKVKQILDALKEEGANFVNVSDLTGTQLTRRGGN